MSVEGSPLCQCGCGQEPTPRRRYISGHNRKGILAVARLVLTCANCGNTFHRIPCHAAVCCSKRCAAAYRWKVSPVLAPQRRAPEQKRSEAVARATAWNKMNIERRREIGRISARRRSERHQTIDILAKSKQISHARHSRLLNDGTKVIISGSYTRADIERLKFKQIGFCANPVCRDPKTHMPRPLAAGFHIDHILPVSRGGSNFPANLQLLCVLCNGRKGAMDMDEFIKWQCGEMVRPR